MTLQTVGFLMMVSAACGGLLVTILYEWRVKK